MGSIGSDAASYMRGWVCHVGVLVFDEKRERIVCMAVRFHQDGLFVDYGVASHSDNRTFPKCFGRWL
jgi:hypothetical protein